VPVSNFGARVSLVIAWKGLQDEVQTLSPQELGGLKSEAYMMLNPQGKMPLLAGPGLALYESEVIVSYLLDRFSGCGPSLKPEESAEARARCELLTRLHDVYLGPLQGAMYRKMAASERATSLCEINRQLDVLEQTLHASGPFAAGTAPSTADAALFPTFCFYTAILPRHFGWSEGPFRGRPRLASWWAAMLRDPQAARVREGIQAGLQRWEDDSRWESIGAAAQVRGEEGDFIWAF
jgi:glutathione S-transferase